MASVNTSEVTAGTASVVLVEGDADGKTAICHNESAVTVYVGGSDVTTTNGFPVEAGGTLSFSTPAGLSFHVVAATAGNAVRIMVLDR